MRIDAAWTAWCQSPITGIVATPRRRLRFSGYVAALAAVGRATDQDLIAMVPVRTFNREHVAEAMRWLLSRSNLRHAVFCLNDRFALEAMRVLPHTGCRVPEDVAIVGVDDIEEGRFAQPTLTTIAPDKVFLARATVDRLVARIVGRRTERAETVYAPFQFLVREHTVERNERSKDMEGDL